MASSGALGRVYEDGEVIVRQGDAGECMYVIQEGRVEVVLEQAGAEDVQEILAFLEDSGGVRNAAWELPSAHAEPHGGEVRLAELGKGDFFGEMAIFEREIRSATVRALGQARVLTVDKRNFLRSIHQDPSMAFRMVQTLSHRIRQLNAEVARLRAG